MELVPMPPTFFLARTPDAGPPELVREDATHARRVLRLGPGAPCFGVDGRGRRWPLRVAHGPEGEACGGLVLEVTGSPSAAPEPGAAGAALPWIEVAVAWPRKPRAEAMLGALVQLGAAAITPLAASHRGPEPVPASPPERWQRIAREACKQSRRTWMPELHGAIMPEDLVEERKDATLAVLDGSADLPFDTWLRSLIPAPLGVGTRERPIVLFVGPEGGFAPEERDAFLLAGASGVRLGPHVLRVETATIAALAVAVTVLSLPGGTDSFRDF